jgi:hypothetical protein
MPQMYDWKRFWCSRVGSLGLSDNDFMPDPEGEYFQYTNSDVVSFDAISHKACLILLGEPGIGKTIAIHEEFNAIESQIAGTEDKCLLFSIEEYSDETRFINEIFDSPDFNDWLKGDYVLHLFIDSLDECRMRMPTVANIISNQLSKVKKHISRMKLRIACRTADWPDVLEHRLPALWNDTNANPNVDSNINQDEYGVYELAPLRRIDVQEAAEKNDINLEEFIGSLIRHEVVPFAIKPITLKFLIDRYTQDGELPSSKKDLYEIGCKCLCEEHNPSWSEIGTDGLSVTQKLEIATHIAAISIFCRKPVIDTGTTQQLNSDEIAISGFVTDGFQYTENNIKEVLATGLFSSRGQRRFGFAHQTYAEYLASDYINNAGMQLVNIESLLYDQIDSDKKVIPQLSEVAAWLSSLNNDVLKSIATNDPQVLLKGDANSYSNEDKRIIVESILRLLEQHAINTRNWDLHSTYHKLKHPGLSEQIRPIIEDRSFDWRYRYDTIEIAECCKLSELQSSLLGIALDTSDNTNVRDVASRFISKIADNETKEQLMPLFTEQGEDDADDQLKGHACRAIWPDIIDAQTLFDNLSIPRKEFFYGSYSSFLSNELIEGLNPESLPYAINWFKEKIDEGRLSYSLKRDCDKVVVLAWRNLSNNEVLESITELLCSCFRRHIKLISENETIDANSDLFENAQNCHLIVEKIVETCEFEASTGVPYYLAGQRPVLVSSRDVSWLIEKAMAATEDSIHKWAKLIRQVYSYDDLEGCKVIIDAASRSEVLKNELWLAPVELDSEQAISLRDNYEQNKKWQEEQNTPQQPEVLEWLPADRIVHWLAEFEKGKLDAWCKLCGDITLEDTDQQYDGERCSAFDITKLPGWQNSDDDIHNRIIVVAETFLNKKAADPLKWIREPNSWSWWDLAPNKAFATLKNNAVDKFNELPVSVWQKWTPALLGISLSGEERQEISKELIAISYAKCPDTFIFFLEMQIDAENSLGSSISVHEKLDNCWDEKLCGVVLNKISQPHINSGKYNSFKNVLSALVRRGYDPAIEYAKAQTQKQWSNEEDRKKIIIASIVLMENIEGGCWDLIWPAITNDPEYGRELLLEFAHFDSHGQVGVIIKQLSEESLANLYIWLMQEFPPSEDPEHDGAHAVGHREAMARFRDSLLHFLENVGTLDACRAIEIIIIAFPDNIWMKSTLVEARKNTRRSGWEPLTPQLFHELLRSGDVRYVNSEIGLLDVVIGSLVRLEEKLQGETPEAVYLWDQIDRTSGQEKFRPKDENAFSDYIKIHLHDDLQCRIIALREVQIRRGRGDHQGENTDVYVTLPATDSRPHLRVIVECKGCWHREIDTAMQDQLVGRYLADNQCRTGLYLVGWYYCSKCHHNACRNSSDNIIRTKPCKRGSIDDFRLALDNQADSLSRESLTIKAMVINTQLF